MHDHKNILRILKTAQGQVESVIKMTEDDRYCLDISTQISASIALLKKAQKQLLVNHLNSCVVDSINEGNPEEKIEEISLLLKKIL
ncbi:MAG TPA: metal-sensing transcriptional repressor [Acholeplasmataceae bacterium]|jgi:DNA-binding FrmR family transcriptional regulator|nr:metal-sensing transcriptional repressor [Acholeplasmataceae bacterium]